MIFLKTPHLSAPFCTLFLHPPASLYNLFHPFVKVTLDYTFIFMYFAGIWIQTLCLVTHVLIFNLGYGCLGYPIMAELLPSKQRTMGLALIMVMGGLFGFVNNMSFMHLQAFIRTEEIFFTYSGINVLGFLYLSILLPNMESIHQ